MSSEVAAKIAQVILASGRRYLHLRDIIVPGHSAPNIRNKLQRHCETSKQFLGKEKLFWTPSTGFWGLTEDGVMLAQGRLDD